MQVFLERVRDPIAVRSSSLLEDSQYHPFAGIYATHMIPNTHADGRIRLAQLCDAIKLVYASTFFAAARKYLEVTPHRIEEEKMAVVLEPVVGTRHGDYFYPNFAGVARSHNYYPFGHMKPEDGVASAALGLGKTVVEGGPALRFCPTHPHILPQLADGEAFLNASQRTFFAVDLRQPERGPGVDPDQALVALDLDMAERHGTLAPIASVWSLENEAFYDGIHRPGVRVVTFAHMLKSDLFPLAHILRRLLQIGQAGMNRPVEIEFAVNLQAERSEFAIVQVRPSVRGGEDDEQTDIDACPISDALCHSPHALGNGVIEGVQDVIYVKPERFDPGRTREIATQIGELNGRLMAENHPYLLIGPGRWGSSTTTLGIPVNWGQISAARIIVETTLENFIVDPSQGSHFFQNLVCFGIGYLTVDPRADRGDIDWAWLDAQPASSETEFLRHVRLEHPLEAHIDGRSSRAIVLKHARAAQES